MYQHGGESSFLTRSSRDGETFDFKRCQSEVGRGSAQELVITRTAGHPDAQLHLAEQQVLSHLHERTGEGEGSFHC